MISYCKTCEQDIPKSKYTEHLYLEHDCEPLRIINQAPIPRYDIWPQPFKSWGPNIDNDAYPNTHKLFNFLRLKFNKKNLDI
jgi:hypothetical protein